ncbi:MAG TPA: hypothetical protein VE734_07760 [Terriglobales bacterium]|nr:hypothetical protein [Terriglobales bacterium]
MELLTTDVRSLERTVPAIAEAVRSHDGQITGLTTASMSLLEAVLQPRAAPEPTGGRRVMLLVPGTKYCVHGSNSWLPQLI